MGMGEQVDKPKSLNQHTYLDHLLEFLHISSDEIEKRQAVKVLSPLICHLHNLMRHQYDTPRGEKHLPTQQFRVQQAPGMCAHYCELTVWFP